MAPAEPHLTLQRVDGLLQSLPRDDEWLQRQIQGLQRIRQALAAMACLVECYGPVFRYGGVFDAFLDHCETLGERSHPWNRLVRRRLSHGEELDDVAVLSRQMVAFVVQFALRSNAPFSDGMPPTSPLGALIRQLDDLKVRVGALKRAPIRGDLRAEALKTHAAELRETWASLCDRTGLSADERLCTTDVLAPSPPRFLADSRWWHTMSCLRRPVLATRPTWGWPTRTRSTPGKTMATITLGGRRYFLHTYRRSTSLPKTIKWAGTTDPQWLAGTDEQPGQPIVLEHKLSVPEREPDLVPYTPHKMHDQDLVVRFSGTQEVLVKEVGERHDRIIFDGMTQPEYSFLDARYWALFHQDLRGRKAVACFDVDNVSSAASAAHSTKLYIWRDAQDPEIPFHTLSFDSQAEGKELEFPLLWLHATFTPHRLSPKCLLLRFRVDSEHDGERRATRRHSGRPLVSSPGNAEETKDVGQLYIPPRYSDRVAKHKHLAVSFESVAECVQFKETFQKAHYEDSLVHLLHCLPTPNPMLGHSPQPSSASWRSTDSSRTATSSGSSTVDYLGLSPTWLPSRADLAFSEALRPIAEPPHRNPEPSAAINEIIPETRLETVRESIPPNPEEWPDGHPAYMI